MVFTKDLQLLCSPAPFCVICSSRAAQVTERVASPEGNRGSQLTRRERDTHHHPHRLLAPSLKDLAKCHMHCPSFAFGLRVALKHAKRDYNGKKHSRTAWNKAHKVLWELELAWPYHLKGTEGDVCACVLMLPLFINRDGHGVSGFKVKWDSKQWSLPTPGQITGGCQTGKRAEWN